MKIKHSFFILILLIFLSINCICAAECNSDAAMVNLDSYGVDISCEDVHLENHANVDGSVDLSDCEDVHLENHANVDGSVDLSDDNYLSTHDSLKSDGVDITGEGPNETHMEIHGPKLILNNESNSSGSANSSKTPKIGPYIDNGNKQIPEVSISSPGTFKDLQAEINDAKEGSTLYLTRDYYGQKDANIIINKDLIINGLGHTIDCLGAENCFAFFSYYGDVTLKNLKIVNGRNDKNQRGGAISIGGVAKFTLQNCQFVNNCQNLLASRVDAFGLQNCQFVNNWASDYGGAIYNGALRPLVIKKCSFKSNKAINVHGGAVYSLSTVTIEDSSFDSNIADENGGGVYSEGDVRVKNSTFSSNEVKSRDWSWYEYIYHWTDNPDCYGGAIYSKGDVYVDNSTFINNRAMDFAGAIYGMTVRINFNKSIGRFDTFFINNVAGDNNGGAILAKDLVSASNACFRGNTALVDGGAIYSERDVDFNHCIFDSNRAEGAKASQCYVGAIYARYVAYISNSTFTNNYAEDYGGAIHANEVKVNVNQVDSTISSFFINNVANDNEGGAIWLHVNSEICNSYFEGNVAKEWGPAIYSVDNIVLCDCSFKKNKCQSREDLSAVCVLGEIHWKTHAVNIGSDEDINITMGDVINATNYSINKISDNAFSLTFNNNATLSLYRFAVYDLESFKNVTSFISNNKIPYDFVLIDFKENLNLEFDSWANVLMKTDLVKNIVIRG